MSCTEQREAEIIAGAPAGAPAWPCGHPRSPENTKPVRKSTGTACRICFRRMNRAYIAKRRAAGV